MVLLQQLCDFLDVLCPAKLAESWDNVGLLLGDPRAEVARVMTCLTITDETVGEAVAQRASLVVSHHPLPFHPLTRLTTATPEQRSLLTLAGAGIAIYSPHTAYDSAAEGINQQLAVGLGLTQIAPLIFPEDAPPNTGSGRCGSVATGTTLGMMAERAKQFLSIRQIQIVGKPDQVVQRMAVACGSAGTLHAAAREAACDCLVTGEARFHSCLEASATGLSLILVGHYASERFGVEKLATIVQSEFSGLTVWASRDERDPLKWH
ncbi:MAG: Nif3-like dinuclear metal center hexameric protein [Planctomycetes bacterium]|nr:Nif3-like dinuclear metal center hexameric protein [Planctomycetota bacterium]